MESSNNLISLLEKECYKDEHYGHVKLNIVRKVLDYLDIIKINCSTPASIHSSIIYSRLGFPLIGSSSLGITLVNGSKRVPRPAKGIIACFIIRFL